MVAAADSRPWSIGGHPALSLHSSNEPGELWPPWKAGAPYGVPDIGNLLAVDAGR